MEPKQKYNENESPDDDHAVGNKYIHIATEGQKALGIISSG